MIALVHVDVIVLVDLLVLVHVLVDVLVDVDVIGFFCLIFCINSNPGRPVGCSRYTDFMTDEKENKREQPEMPDRRDYQRKPEVTEVPNPKREPEVKQPRDRQHEPEIDEVPRDDAPEIKEVPAEPHD